MNNIDSVSLIGGNLEAVRLPSVVGLPTNRGQLTVRDLKLVVGSPTGTWSEAADLNTWELTGSNYLKLLSTLGATNIYLPVSKGDTGEQIGIPNVLNREGLPVSDRYSGGVATALANAYLYPHPSSTYRSIVPNDPHSSVTVAANVGIRVPFAAPAAVTSQVFLFKADSMFNATSSLLTFGDYRLSVTRTGTSTDFTYTLSVSFVGSTYQSSVALQKGIVYHIAVTMSASRQLVVYVNGQVFITANVNPAPSAATFSWFGANHGNTGGTYGQYGMPTVFQGKALTAAEVMQLYNAARAPLGS